MISKLITAVVLVTKMHYAKRTFPCSCHLGNLSWQKYYYFVTSRKMALSSVSVIPGFHFRLFVSKIFKDLDEMLPYVLFVYRETPHEETGFSPLELLYGWPVRGRTEILKLAMTGEEDVEKSVIEHVINVRGRLSEMRDSVGKNLTDKQSKMKAWYDRNTRKCHFSTGDKVAVFLPTEISKMTATWKGP
jgi:hypothetical protein